MAAPRPPTAKQFVSPPYVKAPPGPRPITVKDNGRPATPGQLAAHAEAQRAKYQRATGRPPAPQPTQVPTSQAPRRPDIRDQLPPPPPYVRDPHTVEESPSGAIMKDKRQRDPGQVPEPLRRVPSPEQAPYQPPWYMWGTREGARTSGDTPHLPVPPLEALPWYDWASPGF